MRRPFLLASTILLTLPACADLGERAGGGCPTGERCSPLTPEGLEFTGPTFGDDWLFADPGVKVTAVGGTQTIGAWDHATGEALTFTYHARFDSSALSVESQLGNQIAVGGVHDGSGELELRDTSDQLMDRIALGAGTIDHTVVRPANGGDFVDPNVERPVALFDGATDVPLVIGLRDAGDGALLDDSMVIDGAGVTQSAWDTFAVASVSGDVSLDVTAGTTSGPLVIPATAEIDSVAGGWWLGDGAAELTNGSSSYVCFHAIAGDAELLGVPWTFAIDGPAVQTQADGLWRNCLEVTASDVGHVTVAATAPGAIGSFEFDVVAGSAKPSRALRHVGAPSPGERAATVR